MNPRKRPPGDDQKQAGNMINLLPGSYNTKVMDLKGWPDKLKRKRTVKPVSKSFDTNPVCLGKRQKVAGEEFGTLFAYPNLPEEVVEEILSRLPVKSLARFRCICKSWDRLTYSKRFISLHLNNYRTSQLLVGTSCVLNVSCSMYFLPPPPPTGGYYVNDVKASKKKMMKQLSLGGSCNGIVCLYNHFANDDVVLWNPATNELKSIPPSGFHPITDKPKYATVGFGFDPKTNDYKILRMVFRKPPSVVQMELYSLHRGSWMKVDTHHDFKVIGNIAPVDVLCSLPFTDNRFVCGVVSPMNKASKWEILCFDMSNETYEIISVSPLLDAELGEHKSSRYQCCRKTYFKLFPFKETIAIGIVYPVENGSYCDIWMLNHFDSTIKARSWSKCLSTSINDGNLMPVGCWGSSQILFQDEQSLGLLRLDHSNGNKMMGELRVFPPEYVTTSVYKESLVRIDDTKEGKQDEDSKDQQKQAAKIINLKTRPPGSDKKKVVNMKRWPETVKRKRTVKLVTKSLDKNPVGPGKRQNVEGEIFGTLFACPNLPEQVVEEILSRLPVKSLARFRCVCKSWDRLTYTKRFISLHLKHYRTSQLLLGTSLVIMLSCSMYFLPPPPPTGGYHINDVVASKKSMNPILLGGSCNGIVCLYGHSANVDVVLWNPATNELKCIQPSGFHPDLPGNSTYGTVGFGFDPKTNDYKILRMVFHRIPSVVQMELYSLRKGSWKKIDCHHDFMVIGNITPNDVLCSLPFTDNRFVCGVVSPINKASKWEIFCFDMSKEAYEMIPVSPSLDAELGEHKSFRYRKTFFKLFPFKETIAIGIVYPVENGSYCDIWMLNNFDSTIGARCWSKYLSTNINDGKLLPVGCWGSSQILFQDEQSLELLRLDNSNGYKMMVELRVLPPECVTTSVYKESLVRIDDSEGVEEENEDSS